MIYVDILDSFNDSYYPENRAVEITGIHHNVWVKCKFPDGSEKEYHISKLTADNGNIEINEAIKKINL